MALIMMMATAMDFVYVIVVLVAMMDMGTARAMLVTRMRSQPHAFVGCPTACRNVLRSLTQCSCTWHARAGVCDGVVSEST